jgi:Protein of unknown function DUF262/Protein of unknown function (DUF1524)
MPEIPAAKSTLAISSEGLGACLTANFLSVPKYQRAFSWDEENVREFLTDINTAFSDGAPEYFMGSLVLQGGEQKFEVVDGQQRLTTASIFIAAVRDVLVEKGQPKVAESLEGAFLITKDIWQQAANPRLVLSVYDNSFYLTNILQNAVDKSSDSSIRESHIRLTKAYTVSKQFIEAFVSQVTNWLERIRGLVDYLTHKVRVIQVVVPNHANAYVIFETLNDRGRDLSASDLLKNYLFGASLNRIEEVQGKWNQMLGVLETHGGDDLLITYIRQLWSATRELAREKELFSAIKDRIKSPTNAVDFATELHEQSRFYSAMLNPGDALWKDVGDQGLAILQALNLLKLERYRPALLALLGNFNGGELVAAMRYLLHGSVRYLVAIGAGGGTLEGAYSEAARKIFTGEITTAKAFAKELQKIIPNDETFRTSFANARLSKAFIARYFLIALEKAARGEENCELVPNDQASEVNLEHVLPENPGANWPDVSSEIVDAYSRRIGNLALLSNKKNSEIGNIPFVEKRKVLTASEFVLTKSIAEHSAWGAPQITERQIQLAHLAVKVWSYKV